MNKNVVSLLSMFKSKGEASWTSVAIEADGLYGVTVIAPKSPGGKPRVIKCAHIPGDQFDVEALTGLSSTISVKGCPWILTLGRKEYSILVVPEPTVQREEFDQAVRWQIGDMLDFPVEDANIAWMQIPTKEHLPNRQPNLYVLLAKNDVIENYTGLFQNAGIDLQAIDVRETAQRNIASLTTANDEGIGALLLEKSGTQFTISFNKELYLDRFIQEPLFAQELDEGDSQVSEEDKAQAGERIVLQIQRSLDFIGRNMSFIDIHRIQLAPAPTPLKMNEFITPHLQVPVETLDLGTIFDFSQMPKLEKEENQALYFTALGGALRSMASGQQISLLKRTRIDLSFAKHALMALGLVVLSILALWGVRQGQVSKAEQAEAASAQQLLEASNKLHDLMTGTGLEAEFAFLKEKAETAQKIMAQADNLGSKDGHAKYYSMLASVNETNLWITNVAIDKLGKAIVIKGRALNKDSVIRYAKKLNATFASSGVQFTSLEMRHEKFGRQGISPGQVSDVAFKLY